ncbi:MAG: AMP-binding protein [bacterium]|nr:AMP-binding protein [bacterium]
MTESRWSLRTVPAHLEQRYVSDGWWTGATLGGRVAEWLAAAPDTGVHIHSRTHDWHGNYADIDQEARRLVSYLRQEGIEPGAAVAFQIPNWRESVVAFTGLAMGSYILVPITHIYGRKEVSFILEESGAVAYISPMAYGHVDYAEIVDSAAPNSLRLHLVVGDGGDRPAPEGVRRTFWAGLDGCAPATELPASEADNIAVLAYTSGTTSDPKGAIHNHRTLLSELGHMTAWTAVTRPNLMGSPVAHATGMLGGVLGPLHNSREIHLTDRWDPGHALEVMLAYDVGGGAGASIFLTSLLDHPEFTPQHAAKMVRVGLGGAPVPAAVGQRAESLGIKIIRAYGSTEHPSVTGMQFDDPAELRHNTDGRPQPGVEMRIVDEDGRNLPAGTPGEIVTRGPELCLGYTNPDLNVAFDSDGWYRTGDIGVVDQHGCLTITDRVKDIIIRGGENLSAAEIEEVIAKVPGVAEVAVVAAPDERLGEHACAVIRLLPGAEAIALPDLFPHLEQAGLARQKWPEELRLVVDYPRTASGKIRKVDLRAQLREGTL